MNTFPVKLQNKIKIRKENNSLRQLSVGNNLVDFSSNDYLGFSKSESIFKKASKILKEENSIKNGATGSRLLSGNHKLYSEVENVLCEFHESESALIFNSGYDANIGFFSSVPQRGDVIFYDEFIHASIRDGIKMSHAKSYKFKHNDIESLELLLQAQSTSVGGEMYIVTESVFSMDGDKPDLKILIELCKKNDCYLVVDEAHAIGVFGENGQGLVQELAVQNSVFARIVTFGKALGCHGAAILGSNDLKEYLINFSRSFIFTTALPPHSLATALSVYNKLEENNQNEIIKLKKNIKYFNNKLESINLKSHFIESDSAIHCCIISGNARVKEISEALQENGFDVKPILSPTVSEGHERLRFCLHSYNSEQEISEVLKLLATFV